MKGLGLLSGLRPQEPIERGRLGIGLDVQFIMEEEDEVGLLLRDCLMQGWVPFRDTLTFHTIPPYNQ